jgi:hypothetical protein
VARPIPPPGVPRVAFDQPWCPWQDAAWPVPAGDELVERGDGQPLPRWAAIALPECGFELGFHPKTMAALKDIVHALIKRQHESVVESMSMAS